MYEIMQILKKSNDFHANHMISSANHIIQVNFMFLFNEVHMIRMKAIRFKWNHNIQMFWSEM